MKEICRINNNIGVTQHIIAYDEDTGTLIADGRPEGHYETFEEAQDAAWDMWHDGKWNI